MSRSGYYAWIKAKSKRRDRDNQDQKDFELILKAYKHRGYDKGVRGIYMRLKCTGLRQSMSRRGNCWDNAPQESFLGHMKDELKPYVHDWKSFMDAKASIDGWMDYYNNERYQWNLAKLSPAEYYQYCITGIYPL